MYMSVYLLVCNIDVMHISLISCVTAMGLGTQFIVWSPVCVVTFACNLRQNGC